MARWRDGGDVPVGVVGGLDHPQVGEHLDEHPAGRIVGEANDTGERIGPGLQTVQGVAVAQSGRTRHKETKEAASPKNAAICCSEASINRDLGLSLVFFARSQRRFSRLMGATPHQAHP